MEFTKSHGTANDFVVLADLDDRLQLSAPFVRALTDRRRGVGADGVIRIGAAPAGEAHVFMDYRNADGSVVEMCGNGVRVVAKHVLDHGLVPGLGDEVVIATRAGDKPVTVVARHPDGRVAEVAVDMGKPVTDPAGVPFETTDGDLPRHQVAVDDEVLDLAVVSMGNPHAVWRVEDVAAAPVGHLGPRIETHPRFPRGVNVGFAQVDARDRLRLRVWERGVGETEACGTGACAAVVALQRQDALDAQVVVAVRGGQLRIHHDGGTVTMTGPAVEVAHGTLDDAWLAAADRGEE
jgi:diaminopimelate epimerase